MTTVACGRAIDYSLIYSCPRVVDYDAALANVGRFGPGRAATREQPRYAPRYSRPRTLPVARRRGRRRRPTVFPFA